MTLSIDADGCPVTDIAIKIAQKHGIACTLVCDTAHEFNKPGVRAITVSKGADNVDFALVNLVQKGDIVVTQDYGLAAMCLARGAVPLHQDGFVYDESNIDGLLHQRYSAQKLRRSGGRLRGPPKRAVEQDKAFAAALERILEEK